MEYFYSKDAKLGFDVVLSEEESKHLSQVLRKRIGDTVYLLDGYGTCYFGNIATVHPKSSVIQVEKIAFEKKINPNKTSVAIALTKSSDRVEWFVEKAVELGVHSIFPMRTERTVKLNIQMERLERILLSAVKQSGQLWKTHLEKVQTFESTVQMSNIDNKLLAVSEGEDRINLKNFTSTGSTLLLIGPEGDFTPKEGEMAKKNGCAMVSLGETRLRVETAALFGLIMLNLQHEE